jgi:RNA polymerase sigma-70 factor (ECF subfamily)
MLQVVLGLEAERIASAYLVSPATMSQRLVRAKARIKDAGIRFAVPSQEHWPERLEAVLAAIYAAYTLGRGNTGDDKEELPTEAISLARLVVKLLPQEPEAHGLLALCLHCESRRSAQWRDGRYIPLPEQDMQQWNLELQREAEQNLQAAAQHQRPGRYQMEAAIQSVHTHRRISGITHWQAIAAIYQNLLSHTSALGAQIGHAIAQSHVQGPEAGLALLEDMPQDRVRPHQPWWAARAELLSQLGRSKEAHEAYQTAIGLSDSPAIRAFLQERCGALAV